MTEREAIRARLFVCIDGCGDTLKEVALRTETNYSYLSALRNKKNFDISAHFIAAFCKTYHYSPNWIIVNQGDKKITDGSQLDRIEKILDELILKLLDGLLLPKHLQNTDLQKLIHDARKRKN
jgi:hypothetical protein